jgi:plastocyanin
MAHTRLTNGWGWLPDGSRILALGIAAVLMLAFAPAAPPVEQAVTLTATDYALSPAEIHVVAGRPIKLTVTNHGTHTHGLRLVLSYGEVPLPTNIPAGDTQTTIIDNPGEPGSYKIYCPVEDHEQRGMVGTIIVEPAR